MLFTCNSLHVIKLRSFATIKKESQSAHKF
nr:MAG TPA: hypothetical protein [Microviridae sp.]